MPLGPKSIALDQTLLQAVCDKIDAHITDAKYMRDERCGNGSVSGWSFVGPGTLSQAEKVAIVHAYENAGWKNVMAFNSADNGERGGLWQVTLEAHGSDIPILKRY